MSAKLVNSRGSFGSHAWVSSACEASEERTTGPFVALDHPNSCGPDVVVSRVHLYGISRHIDTVGVVVGLDRNDPAEVVEKHCDLGRSLALRSLSADCTDLDRALAHIRCFSVVPGRSLGRNHFEIVVVHCNADSPGCWSHVLAHSLATVSGRFCCRSGIGALHFEATAGHIDYRPSS